MAAEFNTLLEYSKKMHSRLFNARTAFYAFEGMMQLTARNRGPKRAEKNIETMNKYKNFFSPAQEGLRVYSLIELAKLYDSSDDALHIDKIVNYTESNLKKLNSSAFKEHNEVVGRPFLEELTARYRGMDYQELLVLRKKLKSKTRLIQRVKTYRDKWIAHDDLKKPESPPKITFKHIRDLLDLQEEILNSVTGKFNSETWSYGGVEKETKHHVALVLDHLNRFEPYRIKEIKRQSERRLKKYRRILET